MTDPRLRANRSSRHDVFGDLDQYPLTFSAYDHVDPREAIVQRGAHRAVAIVAAEHDRERRIPRLENLRQDERGHILLKHAGKADDAWRPGEEFVCRCFEKFGDEASHAGGIDYFPFGGFAAHVIQISLVVRRRFREGRNLEYPVAKLDDERLESHLLIVFYHQRLAVSLVRACKCSMNASSRECERAAIPARSRALSSM